MLRRIALAALLLSIGMLRPVQPSPPADDIVNTFSICAYDPEKQDWGVAVASKYLAVGAVVPWAKAILVTSPSRSFLITVQ